MGELLTKRNLQRVTQALYGEVAKFTPKLQAMYFIDVLRPRMDPLERATWLRRLGFRLGDSTCFEAFPEFSGNRDLFSRLVTGCECEFAANCVLDLEDTIVLGDRVTIGQGVMILTSTHELGPSNHRAGNVTRAPVRILDGAWVQARSIILPGVTVGAGSIVSVGSVVNKDVSPHTRVSGVPASQVEALEGA